jgi:hypothetical protein
LLILYRWESEHCLPGSSLGKALEHLRDKGICTTSHAIGADILGTKVRSVILDAFRWNVSSIQKSTRKRSRGTAKLSKKSRGRKNSQKRKCSGRAPPSPESFNPLTDQTDEYAASGISLADQRDVTRDVPGMCGTTLRRFPGLLTLTAASFEHSNCDQSNQSNNAPPTRLATVDALPRQSVAENSLGKFIYPKLRSTIAN